MNIVCWLLDLLNTWWWGLGMRLVCVTAFAIILFHTQLGFVVSIELAFWNLLAAYPVFTLHIILSLGYFTLSLHWKQQFSATSAATHGKSITLLIGVNLAIIHLKDTITYFIYQRARSTFRDEPFTCIGSSSPILDSEPELKLSASLTTRANSLEIPYHELFLHPQICLHHLHLLCLPLHQL